MNFSTSITPASNDKELMVIEKITVTVVDEGVQLYIKSPILHAWAAKRDKVMVEEGIPTKDEKYFPVHSLPPEWDWHMAPPHDSFNPNNMFWLLSKDLKEGFTHTFKVPVLVPAELSDYIQGLCQNASKVYTRYINQPKISGALRVEL